MNKPDAAKELDDLVIAWMSGKLEPANHTHAIRVLARYVQSHSSTSRNAKILARIVEGALEDVPGGEA